MALACGLPEGDGAGGLSLAVAHELELHHHYLGNGVAFSGRIGELPAYHQVRAIAEGLADGLNFDRRAARHAGHRATGQRRRREPWRHQPEPRVACQSPGRGFCGPLVAAWL